MIILRSKQLLVRIDPAHGAEVLDIVDLPSGRQVLGHPPFSSAKPRAGDLDEATWTASYRGGWQMLTPNAGNACTVDGANHGFHGRASNDPWQVISADDHSATLAWTGHGLAVTRRFDVGESLRVSVTMKALDKHVPAIVIEHVAFGYELLDPAARVELAGGDALELPDGTTDSIQNSPARWPEARMLGGGIERADRVPIDAPRTALIAVANLTESSARIVNEGNQFAVTMKWDIDPLRHMWIWQEIRKSAGPWRHAAELLVIEPASFPQHLGLAEAIRRGEALWLNPGESRAYSIELACQSGK